MVRAFRELRVEGRRCRTGMMACGIDEILTADRRVWKAGIHRLDTATGEMKA